MAENVPGAKLQKSQREKGRWAKRYVEGLIASVGEGSGNGIRQEEGTEEGEKSL